MIEGVTIASLEKVSKRLRRTQALDEFDMAIHPGELVALLGPNGAGKTTAVKVMVGLRPPDSGRALLLGGDPRDAHVRQHIGVTPQEFSVPDTLKVREIIRLVQVHFANPKPVDEILRQFRLEEVANRQAGGCSGGQQQRLSVAVAFVGNPSIVFLDEPSAGLDVEARSELWETVRDYIRGGGTALLTTHYLEEAEALADRVVLINYGRKIAEGTVAEIRGRVNLKRIRLRSDTLPPLPGVARVDRDEEGYFVIYAADSDRVVRELVNTCSFQDLTIHPATLEQAFRALINGSG